MDCQSIHLSKKQLQRFLEIADGNHTAANTPDEDALFRFGLIRETMLAFANLSTVETSVDMRAVVLTDFGKEYHSWYLNQRETSRIETRRYMVATLLSLIGLAIAAASLWLQLR